MLRRHVTRGRFGAAAEEMLLHLLGEPLPRARIGKRKPILVDEHRLMPQPLRPGFLGYVLVDSLAELARVRREVEPFRLSSELHAFHHSGHDQLTTGLK